MPASDASSASLFSQGRSLVVEQRHAEALDFLRIASEKSPEDPRILYVLAYCQRGLGENDAAAATASAACQLERANKNVDWSRLMEKFQGPARFWLEAERREQLKSPPQPRSGK